MTEQLTQQSEAYNNFINSLDSEATKHNYRRGLKFFMRFCKAERCESLLQYDQKKTEGIIRDYIIHMRQDRGLASNSVEMYFSAVVHFYAMNDMIINWKKLRKFKAKRRDVINDLPYSREQIKNLLDFANLRMQCCILLMASAGLRKGAIPNLKIGDLHKVADQNLYKIAVYRNEIEQYTTFCTPECARTLDQYFEYRQRMGETLSPSAPTIRKEFSRIDAHRPEPVSFGLIDFLMKKLLHTSGVRPRSRVATQHTKVMQTHGFRKHFFTICVNCDCNPVHVEWLMGHKTGLTKSYFKPTDNELLETYLIAAPALTINPTDEENRRLKQQLADMKVHSDSKYEELQKSINSLWERVSLNAANAAKLPETEQNTRR